MAMNFWEAQRRARSHTTIYLIIFIFLTLVVATLSEYALRFFAAENYHPPYPIFGLIFLAITFGVAGFEYLMYKSIGGSYVANSVGAVLVDPETSNFKEQQLLNIVQEMALAASLPVPPVYLLNAKEINAFAAGTTPENAAITVTAGTLNHLSRDELQGVIAHEFGHVYNGDMKISMRLAAMVMGFFFILYLGLRLLQFAPSRDSKEKGANPILVAALIFLIGGALTWLFGSILKAAVSREREYLADACAVQFTRNPWGISNALRKIDRESKHDMPKSGMAYSHLYLDNHDTLDSVFATHPPIKKRIEAIEDRQYIPDEWNIPDEQKSVEQENVSKF